MSYIVLTPVGNHKLYSLDQFLEAVRRFEPKPAEIVLCIDLDCPRKDEISKIEDIKVLYNPEIFVSPSYLERICSAREILRKYFIYSKYEWALWIDSDIICPPETPKVLLKVAEKKNCILVSNQYPARTTGYWSGSGCMLTHKLACTLSKFWIGRLGKKNISEDFVFLSIVDKSKYFIREFLGKEARVVGKFIKVEHILR